MLPVELIEIIVSYLDINSFNYFEQSNKYLNNICNNDNFCMRLCNNKYKNIVKPLSLTWYLQYKTLLSTKYFPYVKITQYYEDSRTEGNVYYYVYLPFGKYIMFSKWYFQIEVSKYKIESCSKDYIIRKNINIRYYDIISYHIDGELNDLRITYRGDKVYDHKGVIKLDRTYQ